MREINIIWQTQNGDATTFEFEYVTQVLFKSFTQNRIFDDNKYSVVLDNSVIIYSCNQNSVSQEFIDYLNKFVEKGYNFYLLHFSNEDLNHNTNYYSKAKHVFRNYYDPNIKETNVTFIPLGFKSGYVNHDNILNDCSEKNITASFIGEPKRDREQLISEIEKLDSSFVHKKYDKIGYLCEDCWIVLHKRLRQVGVVKKDW